MSYEGLAVQMKHKGCPINASALFRIEKGDPPRRITVDELLAFSQVFGIPVDNLLLPPEVAAREDLVRLVVEWDRAQAQAATSAQAEKEAWESLRGYIKSHPDVGDDLAAVTEVWAGYYYSEQAAEAQAWLMTKLTSSPEWAERWHREAGV